MRRKQSTPYHAPGFLLPVVLILLAGMLFFVVLGLSLVSDSRSEARWTSNDFHLENALESAVQEALGLLISGTNREHFLTHYAPQNEGSELPVPLLSWYEESTWHHLPLQSAAAAQRVPVAGGGDSYQAPRAVPQAGEKLAITHRSPLLHRSVTGEVPSVSVDEKTRYAFWIEDLGGRLDYEAVTFVGQNPHHSSDPTLTTEEQKARHEARIRDQREVGLNIFDADPITAKREYPIDREHPLGKRLANYSDGSEQNMPHRFEAIFADKIASYSLSESSVASFLPSTRPALQHALKWHLPETYEAEIVPYGLSYQNAGRMKADLNALVLKGDVEAVAQQIREVPGFQDHASQYEARGIAVTGAKGTRYGGFPTGRSSYSRTLAASIIDYADHDHEPTLSPAGADRSYRGIDGFPYWNEMARAYHLAAATKEGVVLEVRTFIELWNPTNQTLTGYPQLTLTPAPSHRVSVGGSSYRIPSEQLYYWKEDALELAPNEYCVIELAPDHDGDFRGEQAAGRPLASHFELRRSGGMPAYSAKLHQSSGNRLMLGWSTQKPGAQSDFSPVDGLYEGSFRMGYSNYILTDPENAYVSGNCVPYYPHEGKTGDPRAQIYHAGAFGTLSYAARASFGGQNDLQSYGKVDFAKTFPDVTYNSLQYGVPPQRVRWPKRSRYLPGEQGYILTGDRSDTSTPAQPYSVYDPEQEGVRAVQILSNRGYYASLGELGNIYDPAQWERVRRPFDSEGAPTKDFDDFGQDMTVEELSARGGGFTLAIGSPEFNAFDRPGYRAAGLLDQFRVTRSPLRSLKARVNLNTASAEVLSALFAGFEHEQDQVLGPFVRQPRTGEAVASALVEAILESRRQKPFLALSQLAGLRDTRSREVFGEKCLYEQNGAFEGNFGINEARWSDAGREELFARTHDLFTIKSRSYRLHLVAAHESKTGRRFRRTQVDVTLHPRRSTDGYIDRTTRPEVVISRMQSL